VWKTVAIVGVGLIGGSIGLALRERRLAERVVGIGWRKTSLRRAKEVGAVTNYTLSIQQGVAEADVIVVATPLAQIVDEVSRVATHCPPAALITDAGSTKAEIVRQLSSSLPRDARFVGSHPLAGSEKSGVRAASPKLFEGRVVVVTPTGASPDGAAAEIGDFWSSLGATVFVMSPEKHDEIVAATSHLPHLLASLIAHSTPQPALPLTATGWQDTTRIAAGDPELWTQILLDNRENVLKSLARFEKTMKRAHAALTKSDAKSLRRLLTEAKVIRDGAAKEA
jgi:prephenate dehydrogenase